MFLPCICTSSLVRRKPLQKNNLCLLRITKKTVFDLSDEETKVTSKIAFIINCLALESENKLENKENILF